MDSLHRLNLKALLSQMEKEASECRGVIAIEQQKLTVIEARASSLRAVLEAYKEPHK